MKSKIRLSELLEHISEELITANEKAGKRGTATMQFHECEIEFAVETEKEGGGGVRLWVLDLKGGAKKTDSNTVRIKFSSIPGQAFQAKQIDEAEDGPELKKQ
jgi:hypothetical protein